MYFLVHNRNIDTNIAYLHPADQHCAAPPLSEPVLEPSAPTLLDASAEIMLF